MTRRPVPEHVLVVLGFGILAVCLTYPLAFHLGSLGRPDNADSQFAVWNVAWVARTLVVDPLHVFDANIFYPHRWTLAYSDSNLGSGILAIPIYWLTRNAHAANNFVLLLSFIASGIGTYYLVRYLVSDRRAAVVSAIGFAFTPYLFGHIPHIQLLQTAGLPFGLLAFHRLADQPTAGRGVALGLIMTAETLLCAYYGVFLVLMIGYAVIFTAVTRRTWNRGYWTAVAIAAGVALVSVLPVAIGYFMVEAETGFNRSLDAAREFSAAWAMYLSSASLVHAPLLGGIGNPREFLFPGLITLGFGLAGAAIGWRARGRTREIAILYASLAVLALWVSFGPGGGLYSVFYSTIPGFTFMRAPSRFGLIVALALAPLAGIAIAAMLGRVGRPNLVAAALTIGAIAELAVPLGMRPVPAIDPVYRQLATLPPGPVLELPVYSHQFRFARTQYMLNSTVHWMPLVVAYTDHFPQDFMENMNDLATFPSREAFRHFDYYKVRYVVFHFDQYGGAGAREALLKRIDEFSPYLRRLQSDERTGLYEVVSAPP